MNAVLARHLRLAHGDAALVNGQMGHLLDYDDTHMGGVVLHASSPTLAALLSAAERAPVSGAALILAYVSGFEAGVRVGQSSPGHHAGGWHLTGTLGHFAAATAVGKLIGLDAGQLTHAMGIAGTQASGMQQNRGTMCKSFHAGRAASNGLLAALLAQKGFDSSEEIVERQAWLLPHLQRRGRAGTHDGRVWVASGRSRATATSPTRAAWCCIRPSTR